MFDHQFEAYYNLIINILISPFVCSKSKPILIETNNSPVAPFHINGPDKSFQIAKVPLSKASGVAGDRPP